MAAASLISDQLMWLVSERRGDSLDPGRTSRPDRYLETDTPPLFTCEISGATCREGKYSCCKNWMNSGP